MLDSEPNVVQVITAGEISDEVDYSVAMFLGNNRGFGLTAFNPRLVRLDTGKECVMMSIDSTFRGDDNKIYGYGEVGRIYLDHQDGFKILYCSPNEEIDPKREELMDTVEPEERPRGKY